jgi:hypothetical protein
MVELQLAGELLRVAVQDRAAHAMPGPVPTTTPSSAETGRGLVLVSQLARGWGSDVLDDGKHVWFELATA